MAGKKGIWLAQLSLCTELEKKQKRVYSCMKGEKSICTYLPPPPPPPI